MRIQSRRRRSWLPGNLFRAINHNLLHANWPDRWITAACCCPLFLVHARTREAMTRHSQWIGCGECSATSHLTPHTTTHRKLNFKVSLRKSIFSLYLYPHLVSVMTSSNYCSECLWSVENLFAGNSWQCRELSTQRRILSNWLQWVTYILNNDINCRIFSFPKWLSRRE